MSETGSRMKPELEATANEWIYLSCAVYVRVPSRLAVVINQPCEACGNNNIVYFHTLQHEHTEKQIQVGIECARILGGEWDLPQLAENETKRKERWRIHYRKPGRCSTTVADLEARGKI